MGMPAALRHVHPETCTGERRGLGRPGNCPRERPVQQDDDGSLATHLVPGGQARNLDVAGPEAVQGRHFALGHRSLLPDEDRKAPLGPRPGICLRGSAGDCGRREDGISGACPEAMCGGHPPPCCAVL